MKIRRRIDQKGFTLVELAIVIVIMGLLVSGVVAGKEILQTASLRGVISEVQKYKIAVGSFNDQYNGLPGDLKNATSYWGAAADCVSPYTAEAGKTCNGNGDGMIGVVSGLEYTEPYTAWDQLSMAKMIEGYYTGAGTVAIVGTNVAASKNIDEVGFGFSYWPGPFNYADALGRRFVGNYIDIGKGTGAINWVYGSAFTPSDGYYIDSKMDDGTPDFGNVLASTGGSASGACVSGFGLNLNYNMGNVGVSCIILVNIDNQ